eukprot:TRINITY_DN2103_c0_g1_i1.p1 TRINITY_DN2103_c0_g1~~TRINITY_DN2103_c0_g1_i1.p1  ORF type:complete len:323 (-),score=68.10 TRINITY_DN2103_c0_g1_i1:220-1188(-)
MPRPRGSRKRRREEAVGPEQILGPGPNPSGTMSDLWKEAFPVGTEWDQYERVYEINWQFTNLEEAFEEGGILHGKRVYLFGCTEPQLVQFNDTSRILHIPAVVAVTSPFPPSDKIGIKSVQMEGEMIVPMREMKMDWVPFIPEDVQNHTSLERYKTQIFTLKCTQRRAALRQLKQERIKKYEYCLPYLYQPLKEELLQETIVPIMYPFDDDKPPIVREFDWELDEYEEFAQNLVQDEDLPEEESQNFQEFVKEKVKEEKKKQREIRETRKRAIESMSEETKSALQNMKFFKFYPVAGPDVPDISECKSPFINRYYGKATEVL